jgi:hypothetical protein
MSRLLMEVDMVTHLLQQAFAEASKLTPEEQEQFAKRILAELADRERQKPVYTGEELIARIEKTLRENQARESKPSKLTRDEWIAFINKTNGSLADDPIERGPQGDYETREEIE